MKERPILFSGPMVHAILDGKKTQTRRLANLPDHVRVHGGVAWTERWDEEEGRGWRTDIRCPYGQPGDRLWVRETWYIDSIDGGGPVPRERGDIDERDIYYRADGECCEQIPECDHSGGGGAIWRPSIHMPRWLSRLTLEVTAIRVERLQAISEADALAEGINPSIGAPARIAPLEAWPLFWDAINGKRAPWSQNPWVWVVEFRRLP